MIGNDEANQRNADFDSDINQSVTNFSIAAILKSSFGQKRLGSIVSSDFPSRHATKSDTRLDTPPSWSASSLTDIPFVHCGKNGQVFQQLKDRLNDAKAVQSSDVFRRDEVSYSVSNSSISQTDIQSERRLSSASRATSPVDLSMNDRQCYLSHPHNFVEKYVPFTQNSIHSHIIQSLFGSGKCLYYPTDPILTAPLHDRSVGNVEGNVPTPIHHIGQNYAHGDQSIDGAKISTKNFNLDRLSSIRRHQFWLEKPTFFGLSSLLPLYMNTTSKSFVRDVVANGYGTNTEIRSRLKLRSAAVRDVANRTRCEKPKISGNERCTNGEVEKDVCVAPHSRKGVNVNCVSEVASTASKTNSHVLDGMQTVSEDKERQLPAWVFCTRYSDRPSSGPRARRIKREDNGRIESDKRPRTAFNSDQLSSLKREFDDCRYLTETRRRHLANALGLSESQIKIWFQNKRAKVKKSSGVKNNLAIRLMSQGLYNHATISVFKDEDDDGKNGDD